MMILHCDKNYKNSKLKINIDKFNVITWRDFMHIENARFAVNNAMKMLMTNISVCTKTITSVENFKINQHC